jgi:hypothetical protein
MNILSLDANRAFSLNNLPEFIDEDIRFCVLDNSDPADPDFFFPPLMFLESFNSPAMVLEIAGKELTMPLDWSLAVGDGDSLNDVEVLPLTSLNDRGFEALLYNPINGKRFEFGDIKIINFYNDVKWFFPKVKPNQLIAIPIDESQDPLCAFFVRDVSKQSEIVRYELLF